MGGGGTASPERGAAGPGGTVVAVGSRRGVPATLAAVAALEPERRVAVCRELTKAHEEVVRGSAAELAERYDSEGADELVFLDITAAPERRGTLLDIVEQFIGPEIQSNPIQRTRIKPPERLLAESFGHTNVKASAWHQDQGVAQPQLLLRRGDEDDVPLGAHVRLVQRAGHGQQGGDRRAVVEHARRGQHPAPEAVGGAEFAAGSMGPKVAAATEFVTATGRRSAIGSLDDIDALVAGDGGTQVLGRSDA